jgi:multidrug efflux pump subunit AcrA (membrane-fusion protein)
MTNDLVLDLADCTEYRVTLLARPPRVVHGVLILLGTALGAALAWAALTEADLVVRAVGTVRPVTPPQQVFIDFRGDVPRASLGIAIAEVRYKQGDRVKQGDLLLRMDCMRLDSELHKQELRIQAGEKELVLLREREKLLCQEFEKAQAEARAEVLQAEKEFQRATDRRHVNVQRAAAELEAARQDLARTRSLAGPGADSAANLEKAIARDRKARSDWEGARLEVVDKTEVYRRKLERQEQEYLGKRADLERERGNRQRAVDVAKSEHAKLVQEHRQAAVYAPCDGVVTSREPKVGDIPKPGEPVVEIAEENGFLFEVEVLNEDMGLLREGLAARVKANAYDYQKYGTLGGRVCFIPPDMSLVQGRAVFLVRIALEGDEVGRGEFHGRVKFGMTGEADIVTDQENLLSLLLRRIRQSISLG